MAWTDDQEARFENAIRARQGIRPRYGDPEPDTAVHDANRGRCCYCNQSIVGCGEDYACTTVGDVRVTFHISCKVNIPEHMKKVQFWAHNPNADFCETTKEAPKGSKHDRGKPRWSLLPPGIRSVVDVLEYGAQKYSVDNWQLVQDPRRRYFDALQRHVWAWSDGETNDPESGLHHMAHAACCALFLIWFDDQNPAEGIEE